MQVRARGRSWLEWKERWQRVQLRGRILWWMLWLWQKGLRSPLTSDVIEFGFGSIKMELLNRFQQLDRKCLRTLNQFICMLAPIHNNNNKNVYNVWIRRSYSSLISSVVCYLIENNLFGKSPTNTIIINFPLSFKTVHSSFLNLFCTANAYKLLFVFSFHFLFPGKY